MLRSRLLALAVASSLVSAPSLAGPLTTGSVERLHYSWSLQGALAWVARLAFPVSGNGTLETRAADMVSSRLTMTTPNQQGHAFYDSRMSADGSRTYASSDGYSWRNRSEQQKVTFDYSANVARIEKHDADGVETKVRQLESETPRDVLTSIFYLRQNASSVTTPHRAQVYSGGKPYTFLFTPQPLTSLSRNGRTTRVRPFVIQPVDGTKKGAVRVWLTEDSRRVPMRIEIEQNHATLRLDLHGN